jgi:uncharacterized protein with HEPN domain
MLSERERKHLGDMLENVELAQKFTEGLEFETLRDNVQVLYAVIRCLEIVSEASRRLSQELKDRNGNIPWNDIAAAGNFYRHNYEGITSSRVWKTLRNDLPGLKATVEAELSSDNSTN